MTFRAVHAIAVPRVSRAMAMAGAAIDTSSSRAGTEPETISLPMTGCPSAAADLKSTNAAIAERKIRTSLVRSRRRSCWDVELAVAGGLEPPTNGLTIRRSTN